MGAEPTSFFLWMGFTIVVPVLYIPMHAIYAYTRRSPVDWEMVVANGDLMYYSTAVMFGTFARFLTTSVPDSITLAAFLVVVIVVLVVLIPPYFSAVSYRYAHGRQPNWGRLLRLNFGGVVLAALVATGLYFVPEIWVN